MRCRSCSTARTWAHCGSAALGDENVVPLEQSSLAEFERGDGTVVLIDCQEFGLESVCPHALSFEQEVERAAAGQELLESCPELYRRGFTLGSLSADQLVELDQVGILLAEELVCLDLLILQRCIGASQLELGDSHRSMCPAEPERHIEA